MNEIMRNGQEITEVYPLNQAARMAQLEPRDLLFAGTHGKIQIMAGVPPGYKLCLLKMSKHFDTPLKFGIPRATTCPNLLLLNEDHCQDLEITGKALVRNAPFGYFMDKFHRLIAVRRPSECDESLPVSEIGNGNYFDPRQQWTDWYVYKFDSGLEMEVSLESVWIAKTELDKFPFLTPINPVDCGEKRELSTLSSINKSANPFPNHNPRFENGKIVLQKIEPVNNFFPTEEIFGKKLVRLDKLLGLDDDEPGNIGGDYMSSMLQRLNEVAYECWNLILKKTKYIQHTENKELPLNEKYKLPFWKNEDIVKKLMDKEKDVGFKQRIAEAATSIIRPEYAEKGCPLEEIDELDPQYLEKLEYLSKTLDHWQSKKLEVLNKSALNFWRFSGVFKEDISTYPDALKIYDSLVNSGFSESLAILAVDIIKPDFAKKEPTYSKPGLKILIDRRKQQF
ncbi:MAG: hypothetical protein JST10_14990 [Bacteroidetes bacterium]|nr:hypothetical protein [Bacteroidota bacterium]